MTTLMTASMWLSGLNILLILGLLYVYGRTLAKTRSMFSLGLALFAFLFLIHNTVSFYFQFIMMPLYTEGVQSFVFIFTLLQAAAFSILNWITWK